MREIRYCSLCANEVERHGSSSYHCGHCKVILYISIEITAVDSPVIKPERCA
jgi:hypothetical protein